jgi:hypothetical protein
VSSGQTVLLVWRYTFMIAINPLWCGFAVSRE